MSSLSTVFPGQPPRFEPHITITTNIAIDLDNAKDEVDRILSSCCIALNSLPRDADASDWVRLGKVKSQRKFFKKLYFQVLRDPTLVSFARIVRELFVILPEKKELEHKTKNPHLFHTDNKGEIVRKKISHGRSRSLLQKVEKPVEVEIDIPQIQKELAIEAAKWSEEFDPHLSLIYSSLHPIDNALWYTIRSRILDYLSIDDCDLDIWNMGNGLSWDGGILKLVLCEGDIKDWTVLGSVDLHN